MRVRAAEEVADSEKARSHGEQVRGGEGQRGGARGVHLAECVHGAQPLRCLARSTRVVSSPSRAELGFGAHQSHASQLSVLFKIKFFFSERATLIIFC